MRGFRAVLGFLILCAAAALPAGAECNTAALVAAAQAADLKNDLEQSARLYTEALDCGISDVSALGNAAVSLARAGRKDDAFAALSQVLELGYSDAGQLTGLADLAPLHADPRWAPLVDKARANRRLQERIWNSPALKTPFRKDLSEDEKIAGLSKLWSEVKFNFANFDLVPDLDWDALYLETLPKVRQTKSTGEYYRVLAQLVARLKDGHTNVYLPEELALDQAHRPPLRTRFIADKVVVTRAWGEELARQGIVPGVEIVAIDGIPVREYAERNIAPFESASTRQDLEARMYEYSLLSGPAKPIGLTLRDAKGNLFEQSVRRLSFEERRQLSPAVSPMELKMLPGNVAYVALNDFGSPAAADQFEARFPEIAKADAIILDVRENGGGSGSVGFRILACLTDKPFKTAKWRTRNYRPAYRAWGQSDVAYGEKAGVETPNGAKLYTKPVALLVSRRTFSAAEDFALSFDVMERGPIVGEPTGGSTGMPLLFDLPGGGKARVCTKRDTYPDGREFVGIGIQPDIAVRPTVEDIRTGRDPVLEAALRALKGK